MNYMKYFACLFFFYILSITYDSPPDMTDILHIGWIDIQLPDSIGLLYILKW